MGSPASEIAKHEAYSDEAPQHRVRIKKAFAVGKFEVTFAQWDACVESGGCRGFRPGDEGWGRGDRPVFKVSWDDAKLYVKWLSNRTGQIYRLLSEAEWEYAARAGSSSKYYFGDDDKSLCRFGNIADESGKEGKWYGAWMLCHDGFPTTAPVGRFVPNAFGLYDMIGNVSEWVEDVWHDTYEGAPTDGSARTTGGDPTVRIGRGGNWAYISGGLRSAARMNYGGAYGGNLVGFRVARTLR